MMKIGPRLFFCSIVPTLSISLFAAIARADPTQADVFKSISDNMGAKTDSSHFIAGMAIVAGVAILIGIFSRQKPPAVKKRSANHPAKLMKEIVRATSLRPAEVKYLRTLAERESIDSPLTLMLCPSVLLKAARSSTSKAEKRVLMQLTRKLGIALSAPLNPARAKPAVAAA